jgi:thymidylate synthase
MKYKHEDGTPFTKEEFLQKLKTDREFNDEFGNKGIDQISDLIKQLKENPDSRRLLVSAWNISDLPNQVLPPCHYSWQVYTRELSWVERREIYLKILSKNSLWKDNHSPQFSVENMNSANIPTRAISLMWNQRSVDTFLGLPFNIASYGLLLEIIAKEVNMIPDELIGVLGDTHIYSNHVEQAKEQIGRELVIEERIKWAYYRKLIDYVTMVDAEELDKLNVPKKTREPFKLPKLLFKDHLKNFDSMLSDTRYGVVLRPKDFILDGYESHPKIEAPLSN